MKPKSCKWRFYHSEICFCTMHKYFKKIKHYPCHHSLNSATCQETPHITRRFHSKKISHAPAFSLTNPLTDDSKIPFYGKLNFFSNKAHIPVPHQRQTYLSFISTILARLPSSSVKGDYSSARKKKKFWNPDLFLQPPPRSASRLSGRIHFTARESERITLVQVIVDEQKKKQPAEKLLLIINQPRLMKKSVGQR